VDVLNGEHNALIALSTEPKPDEIIAGLGTRFFITETSIKPDSVGYPIQAPLDAFLTLLRAHKMTVDNVERIVVRPPEDGARVVYGIQLGPNVFSMFDRLGITDAVLAQSITPKAVLMIDSVDAGIIVRIPTGASFRERFKRPYIVIHRVASATFLVLQGMGEYDLIPLV
jgi:hypothetical protein